MRLCSIYLIFIIMLLASSCKETVSSVNNVEVDYQNIVALNGDSTINMVVEIPAGTTAKYEMNKETHQLELDSIDGKPRYIDYLGYPGNYGMIPKTLLSKEQGGDGDPLDILLLGTSRARGSVVKCKIIGVLKLLDNGEQDDKIIAVPSVGKWANVKSTQDLDDFYPGSRRIVSTFFINYKGSGEMEFIGWGDESEAWSILSLSKN